MIGTLFDLQHHLGSGLYDNAVFPRQNLSKSLAIKDMVFEIFLIRLHRENKSSKCHVSVRAFCSTQDN